MTDTTRKHEDSKAKASVQGDAGKLSSGTGECTRSLSNQANPVFRQHYAPNNFVHVLFLGELAKLIGMNALELPLEQSTTVADIKSMLADQLIAWKLANEKLWHTVNRNLAKDGAMVNMGDEVAFFLERPV